jgi:hypothetical protein
MIFLLVLLIIDKAVDAIEATKRAHHRKLTMDGSLGDIGIQPHKRTSKGKGRRKIPIEYIQSPGRRGVTLSKRKAGLMKKAHELAVLSGSQVMVLVLTDKFKMYSHITQGFAPMIKDLGELSNPITRCVMLYRKGVDVEGKPCTFSGTARRFAINYAGETAPRAPRMPQVDLTATGTVSLEQLAMAPSVMQELPPAPPPTPAQEGDPEARRCNNMRRLARERLMHDWKSVTDQDRRHQQFEYSEMRRLQPELELPINQ